MNRIFYDCNDVIKILFIKPDYLKIRTQRWTESLDILKILFTLSLVSLETPFSWEYQPQKPPLVKCSCSLGFPWPGCNNLHTQDLFQEIFVIPFTQDIIGLMVERKRICWFFLPDFDSCWWAITKGLDECYLYSKSLKDADNLGGFGIFIGCKVEDGEQLWHSSFINGNTS